MLSWFIAMLINQNQDKVCSRDWVSPWEVFKMIMIAQAGEQDIFTKKKGVLQTICLGEDRIFLGTGERWFSGTATSADTQAGARGRAPTQMHPCTHTDGRVALSPEILETPLPEGHCFPRAFITAAAEGNMLGSYCLHLPRDNCLNRAGIQKHRAPLMTEQPEPFVLSPDFHPQCGVGHREASPCFLPTLAQWAGKKLSFPPMTSWKFSTTGFREAEIP